MSSKFCPHCGCELLDTSYFCGNCGTKIETYSNTNAYAKTDYNNYNYQSTHTSNNYYNSGETTKELVEKWRKETSFNKDTNIKSIKKASRWIAIGLVVLIELTILTLEEWSTVTSTMQQLFGEIPIIAQYLEPVVTFLTSDFIFSLILFMLKMIICILPLAGLFSSTNLLLREIILPTNSFYRWYHTEGYSLSTILENTFNLNTSYFNKREAESYEDSTQTVIMAVLYHEDIKTKRSIQFLITFQSISRILLSISLSTMLWFDVLRIQDILPTSFESIWDVPTLILFLISLIGSIIFFILKTIVWFVRDHYVNEWLNNNLYNGKRRYSTFIDDCISKRY